MYKIRKSKFLILIPAYNELNNLKKFVKKVNKFAPLYILDDCSTDGTEQWLLKNKIKYKKNQTNLGYEKNLLSGIKKYKNNCKYLITFDGDGQHQVSDLKKVLKIKMNYDVLICNRKNKNRFLEKLISFFSEKLYGFMDPLSGFKVYNTKIFKEKNFIGIGNFFLIDFLLKISKDRFKIINITIITKRRIGKPKVGGLLSISFKEFKILLKLIKFKLITNNMKLL